MPRIEAPTVAEHHARQQAKILDGATRLFTERNLHDVSMGDIAAAAGLRRSSLYRYFASRDELVVALFQRDQAEYLSRSTALLADGGSPLARLLTWADFQLSYAVEPAHAIGNQVLGEAGALSPAAADTVREGHRQLLRAVGDTIAEQLGDRGPEEAAQLTEFVGSVVLTASRLAVEQGPTPGLRRLLRDTLTAMLEARA